MGHNFRPFLFTLRFAASNFFCNVLHFRRSHKFGEFDAKLGQRARKFEMLDNLDEMRKIPIALPSHEFDLAFAHNVQKFGFMDSPLKLLHTFFQVVKENGSTKPKTLTQKFSFALKTDATSKVAMLPLEGIESFLAEDFLAAAMLKANSFCSGTKTLQKSLCKFCYILRFTFSIFFLLIPCVGRGGMDES